MAAIWLFIKVEISSPISVAMMSAGHAPELVTGCGEPTIDTRQPKRADEY